MDDTVTYANTPEMACLIGWDLVPEYHVGDDNAPYVTHYPTMGLFVFTDKKPVDIRRVRVSMHS